MSIISNIETAILGLLCESPRYGYELEKIIEERGMRNWTEIGFSSIYYVLKRLDNKGLIEGKIEAVEGKPARKIYTITETGMEVMRDRIKAVLSKNEKLISSFDLGIAYQKLLSPGEVLECLELYQGSINEQLIHLEDKLQAMEEANSPFFVIALFTRPIAHLKAEKEWVEMYIKKNLGKEVKI